MRNFTLLTMLLLGISTFTFSQDFVLDNSFEKALVEDGFDTDGDNQISKAEAHVVTAINVESEKLASLTGIGEFKNLKTLRCAYNDISTLDLTGCLVLEELQCFQNILTSLNVTGNSRLTRLACMENQLTSIDVSNNLKLNNFQCYKNNLTSLDVSANTELNHLALSWNKLTSLDVSKNKKLKYLAFGQNTELRDLYTSTLPNLTFISVGVTKLSSLDLSSCRLIETVYATGMQYYFKSICLWDTSIVTASFMKDSQTEWTTDCALTFNDFSFRNILVLRGYDPDRDGIIRKSDVAHVKILNLDASAFRKTQEIILTNIVGISGFDNLQVLSVNNHDITNVDISVNKKIYNFSCKNNKLTELDVSENTSLTYLNCKQNSISTIYVWDIPYAESKFKKDASAVWAIHGALSVHPAEVLKTSMYPMPINDFMIIESEEDAEVAIYNLLGSKVMSGVLIRKGHNRINLNLNPNVYIISIKGETTNIVKRIMVK